jgi:two-component system sensor histidine kinase VicK
MTKSSSNRPFSKANEERFHALISVTSDSVFSMNADCAIVRALDSFASPDDSGQPLAEWLSKYVHRSDHDIFQRTMASAAAGKTMFQLEHRINRNDGTVGWTFLRIIPIFNQKGTIKEWLGLASDITERKQAEEILLASREIVEQQKRTYETIISGTPDLMYIFDLQYKFTYANTALLNMWGKSWDEAIGKGLTENGYEKWHAEMHEREIDTVVATRTSVRGEVAFPHATLGRRLYDYILNPVFDHEGNVIAVTGTTRDVTERDQWEQRLKESSEKLQAMNEEFAAINEELTASNEQIQSTNEHLSEANAQLILAQQSIEEGKVALRLAIDAANFGTWYIHSITREFVTDARLKELFGYLPDEPLSIDQAIAQITDEYRDFVSDKLENAIYNNGEYDVSYPVVGLHDGKLRWVRAIGNLKVDPSGTFSAFTGVVMDITEQKMEEIRKNDFMGVISHELKTPLTSMTAYLQLVELRASGIPDTVIRRALSQSLKQTKRMTDMINGFLDFSRLESAMMHLQRSVFDIADLIRESEEEARLLYGTHMLIFDPVESQLLSADKGKLGQVIANLIGNAVKYSQPHTTIHVFCLSDEARIEVGIRDEGLGINKEELSRIFERFYRVDGNDFISGFGIGLYVCSEIIKLHEGKLWAESEIGKGSLFRFSLPIKQ